MEYIYTMEYYSATKRNKINAICRNMDGPKDYHTEWSHSARERHISHDIAYMWNLKTWYKQTYLQNRNRVADIEHKLLVTKRKREQEIIRSLGITYTQYYI